MKDEETVLGVFRPEMIGKVVTVIFQSKNNDSVGYHCSTLLGYSGHGETMSYICTDSEAPNIVKENGDVFIKDVLLHE